MNGFAKFALFVAAAIAFVYVLMISTMFGVTPSIAPRKDPMPESFDPSQYQTLIDLKSTDQMHVENVNGLGDPFHPAMLADPAVLYLNISRSDYDGFYLFFNSKGSGIGQRDKPRTTFPIGNTFVSLDGHYEVTADAIGPIMPYVDVEGGAVVPFSTVKTLRADATYFYAISHHDAPRGSDEYKNKIHTYIMLIDGVWTRAKANNAESLQWKIKKFEQFHTQYRFKSPDDPDQSGTRYNEGGFYDGKYTIHRTWFDQQEYVRRRAASIGSTTGQGRPEHWRGTGYYSVSAGDKSIGFAIANDRQIISGSGRFTMKVLGHNSLDLILIERYAGSDTQYFVISTKDD